MVSILLNFKGDHSESLVAGSPLVDEKSEGHPEGPIGAGGIDVVSGVSWLRWVFSVWYTEFLHGI